MKQPNLINFIRLVLPELKKDGLRMINQHNLFVTDEFLMDYSFVMLTPGNNRIGNMYQGDVEIIFTRTGIFDALVTYKLLTDYAKETE